jgi:hypothetical protein
VIPSTIPFPVPAAAAEAISRGLKGLMAVEEGPSQEQWRVFSAVAITLLGQNAEALRHWEPLAAEALAAALPEPHWRRLVLQVGIVLDLCRHPKSEAQLQRLEHYCRALQQSPPELEVVRAFAHQSAAQATATFTRLYSAYTPALSEHWQGRQPQDASHLDHDFFAAIGELAGMPAGSLGRAFCEFYARNGMTMPSRDTPNPAYYIGHDMNHVIAGYEPTGPGEVALGAFKLALNNSEANWMASLTNLLIHEVGLFMHGSSEQFVPYGGGGEPYHGLNGRRGVLDLPGAPELFAEGLVRGASCSGDFSTIDHLAIAAEPLVEIRRRFHVLPLRQPMLDEPERWPSSY